MPSSLALRALRQPFTIAAVVVLLLNDHWFKAAAPSWWTGKLSDFAGLFFFPFVLTAFGGGWFAPLRLRPRTVFLGAVSVTGVWFTLIKTVPLANALTGQLVSWLLGNVVQIVLDPSDLLALPMLGLAWRQWHRLEKAPNPPPPDKRAYAMLAVSSLAALATTCLPAQSANWVTVADDGFFYVGLAGYYKGAEQPAWIFYSVDHGVTWQAQAFEAATLPADLRGAVTLPKTVCLQMAAQRCYRITGDERVYESVDGGQTWQVAWEVPWGRRTFLARLEALAFVCPNPVNLGPYDLAVWEQDGAHGVVVAAGSQGLLIRDATGQWRQQGIAAAAPMPLALAWPESLTPEAWLGLLFYVWPEVLVSWGALPVLWLGLSVGVWRARRRQRFTPQISWVVFVAIGQTLGFVALTPGWFVLWVLGAIPFYEMALVGAGVWVLGVVWRGWRQVQAAVSQAA